ncbi:MAG: A24 family peptidase C-terminal domain-containing protein [Candidatus Hodarchaeales archaeon]
MYIIELAAGITGFAFLVYGSYFDWKIREVEDIVWKRMIGIALLFNVIRIFLYPDISTWIIIAVSMITGIATGFLLVMIGFWGGADGKAMICISILSPLSPIILNNTIVQNTASIIVERLFPFSVTVFMNSYIAIVPIPVILLVFNLYNYWKNPHLYRDNYPLWKKIMVSSLGYPSSLHEIKKKNIWKYDILESANYPSIVKKVNDSSGKLEGMKISARIPRFKHRIVNLGKTNNNISAGLGFRQTWKMEFVYGLADEVDDEYRRKSTLDRAEKAGKNKLWLLYAIPFLIPLAFGYFTAIFFGNLIFQFFIALAGM